MAPSVSICVDAPDVPLASKAADLLARTIRERSGLEATGGDDGECRIHLEVDPAVGVEGFRIDGDGGEVRITGGDGRGLLYGVGKLLRGCRWAPGRMDVGPWRGLSRPAKAVRGIYFATHFHNFYHQGPIEAIRRYVEELALWGCNTLSVWFDMHHFTGLSDPAAGEMVSRLHAILAAANEVGIGASLTSLSNEAFADSPPELRADWTAGHDGYTIPPGGHYHVEICPAKPGGTELILAWRREVLEAFADLEIDYVWLWPYDQGGCTCPQCTPWGANGFLKLADPLAGLVREVLPDAKIVLSTWYFEKFIRGEFDGLGRFLTRRPDWLDALMINGHDPIAQQFVRAGKVPPGVAVLDFPEISMAGMWPWGGFGANPQTTRLADYRDETADLVAGGFPYSEGIFEDLNKVLMLGWYWDPSQPAEAIVREYAAAEFSHDVAGDVVRAVAILDANLDHNGGTHGGPAGAEVRYRTGSRADAAEALALLDAAAARLPEAVTDAWRWRVLRLRAALDAEIARSGGAPTDRTDAQFDELAGIYYADQASRHSVSPPSRAALKRLAAARPAPT